MILDMVVLLDQQKGKIRDGNSLSAIITGIPRKTTSPAAGLGQRWIH
jgi:hypothetical protein